MPPSNVVRWTPRRKAAVVTAIRNGAISRYEARSRYRISAEELVAWERTFDRHGLAGLYVTRLQQYGISGSRLAFYRWLHSHSTRAIVAEIVGRARSSGPDHPGGRNWAQRLSDSHRYRAPRAASGAINRDRTLRAAIARYC